MMRLLVVFTVVASACGGTAPATNARVLPPPPPPSAPRAAGELPRLPLHILGALEFEQSAPMCVWATRIAAASFTVRGGATITAVIGPVTGVPDIGILGPVPASGDFAGAPRWAGVLERSRAEAPRYKSIFTVRATLTDPGTYLLGMNVNDETVPVRLTCESGECRPECAGDGACPDASACQRVACDEGPCTSYCAPPNAGTAPADDWNAGVVLPYDG
jgi:hypothetical protein